MADSLTAGIKMLNPVHGTATHAARWPPQHEAAVDNRNHANAREQIALLYTRAE